VDAERWIQNQKSKFVLYEAALITGKDSRFDGVILVSATQKTRLERALKRDPHRNKAEILKIFDAQMKDEDWINEVDYVIQNNDTDSVLEQTLLLDKALKKPL
jgi:dephospho-CoA kinase